MKVFVNIVKSNCYHNESFCKYCEKQLFITMKVFVNIVRSNCYHNESFHKYCEK